MNLGAIVDQLQDKTPRSSSKGAGQGSAPSSQLSLEAQQPTTTSSAAAAVTVSATPLSSTAPPQQNAFSMLLQGASASGAAGGPYLLPQSKLMVVSVMMLEFKCHGLDPSSATSWSGSKPLKSGLGVEANSHAKSRIRQVHTFIYRYITPTLSVKDQASLAAKLPPRTPAEPHSAWLKNFRAAADQAQIEAVKYLKAREIQKKLDEAMASGVSFKESKTRTQTATVESIANRIEGLGGIDRESKERKGASVGKKLKVDGHYLSLKLTSQQQSQLLANDVSAEGSGAGGADGEESEQDRDEDEREEEEGGIEEEEGDEGEGDEGEGDGQGQGMFKQLGAWFGGGGGAVSAGSKRAR